MNPRALLFLLLTPGLLAADEPRQFIRFANKDRIAGAPSAIAKDRILWSSPELARPAEFKLDQVIDLFREVGPVAGEGGLHTAEVTLTNGDVLHGKLSGVNDTTIELDTAFAGRLLLRRAMVSTVNIIQLPKVLFRGPESIDGWTLSQKTWSFVNGSLRSEGAGSVAREIAVPDRCRIAFNLAWHPPLRFRFIAFSSQLDTENPTDGCQFVCRQRWINIGRRDPAQQGIPNPIGNANVPELGDHDKARFEIFFDRKTGVVWLKIDGRSIDFWTDPGGKPEKPGNGFHFISEDSQPLKVSHIEVSDWDGVVDHPKDEDNGLEEEEEEDPDAKPKEPEAPPANRMLLRNGDSIAGEVLSIHDGVMRVKTPFSELDLPVSRLKNLTLKAAAYEEAKLMNGDVRAWLPEGGHVTFRLDGEEGGTLTGFSQNFGSAKFRLETFKRLEFNLYNTGFDALRAEEP